MTKPKTLEQLRAEKERAEAQLLQEQHKLQRLEQRKKHYEKGERKKRTHRLCNLGGTIESLAPEVILRNWDRVSRPIVVDASRIWSV